MRNAVVTIGTFDGVHLGHAALLKRVSEIAKEVGGETVLLSFYPHPRMVLYPDDHNISLITSPDEKATLLEACGLDHLVIYPFSAEFSRMSAFEYVRDLIVKGLRAHTVVVGYDHRFGRNREGDFKTLVEMSDVFGFAVEEIPAKDVDAILVSSTKVRNALLEHRIDEANMLLGRPYALKGHVVKSRQLGREIGFPTANLRIINEEKLIPANGVYAVRVTGPCLENKIFDGMMNIGIRPTVDGQKKVIEVKPQGIYNLSSNIGFSIGDVSKLLIKGYGSGKMVVDITKQGEQFILDNTKLEAALNTSIGPFDFDNIIFEIGKKL